MDGLSPSCSALPRRRRETLGSCGFHRLRRRVVPTVEERCGPRSRAKPLTRPRTSLHGPPHGSVNSLVRCSSSAALSSFNRESRTRGACRRNAIWARLPGSRAVHRAASKLPVMTGSSWPGCRVARHRHERPVDWPKAQCLVFSWQQRRRPPGGRPQPARPRPGVAPTPCSSPGPRRSTPAPRVCGVVAKRSLHR